MKRVISTFLSLFLVVSLFGNNSNFDFNSGMASIESENYNSSLLFETSDFDSDKCGCSNDLIKCLDVTVTADCSSVTACIDRNCLPNDGCNYTVNWGFAHPESGTGVDWGYGDCISSPLTAFNLSDGDEIIIYATVTTEDGSQCNFEKSITLDCKDCGCSDDLIKCLDVTVAADCSSVTACIASSCLPDNGCKYTVAWGFAHPASGTGSSWGYGDCVTSPLTAFNVSDGDEIIIYATVTTEDGSQCNFEKSITLDCKDCSCDHVADCIDITIAADCNSLTACMATDCLPDKGCNYEVSWAIEHPASGSGGFLGYGDCITSGLTGFNPSNGDVIIVHGNINVDGKTCSFQKKITYQCNNCSCSADAAKCLTVTANCSSLEACINSSCLPDDGCDYTVWWTVLSDGNPSYHIGNGDCVSSSLDVLNLTDGDVITLHGTITLADGTTCHMQKEIIVRCRDCSCPDRGTDCININWASSDGVFCAYDYSLSDACLPAPSCGVEYTWEMIIPNAPPWYPHIILGHGSSLTNVPVPASPWIHFGDVVTITVTLVFPDGTVCVLSESLSICNISLLTDRMDNSNTNITFDSSTSIAYPNPIEKGGTLYINQDNLDDNSVIQILSLNGQVVQKIKKGEHSVVLDNNLLPGVYFLKITNNNKVESMKFIVQ